MMDDEFDEHDVDPFLDRPGAADVEDDEQQRGPVQFGMQRPVAASRVQDLVLLGDSDLVSGSVGAHIELFACGHLSDEVDNWDGVDWLCLYGVFDPVARCPADRRPAGIATYMPVMRLMEANWWADVF